MKFLEATRILDEFEGGVPLALRVLLSGTLEPLDVFVRAVAAERGIEARVSSPPFNTLRQALMEEESREGQEVVFLLPWDFVPTADWRSGLPRLDEAPDFSRDLEEMADLLTSKDSPLLYLPAPVPPLTADSRRSERIEHRLLATAEALGASVLDPTDFSMKNYLAHGNPVGSAKMGSVARALVDLAVRPPAGSGKVLVTDFDNTLWSGVVGEDGVEGIRQDPQGPGFPHFLFQTFAKALKDRGVLVAGVTRNDPEIALAPFAAGDTHLMEDDFVTIVASYEAKSSQIRAIADSLNLGLDAFAFVDDNPVELAEVSRALPEVMTVAFPSDVEELSELFRGLSRFFHRDHVTDEDAERTQLYRRRLAGMVPRGESGADIEGFLRGLEMVLTIHNRSQGNRDRAVQLINKTNQFNLNGIRLSDDDVQEVLDGGGSLYTASLRDRHGSHGEILAFLIDRDGIVRSLVLSCRVFQRRVEHAFLVWIASQGVEVNAFRFRETARNEPLRRFLADGAFSESQSEEALVTVDLDRFVEQHRASAGLHLVEEPALESA